MALTLLEMQRQKQFGNGYSISLLSSPKILLLRRGIDRNLRLLFLRPEDLSEGKLFPATNNSHN